MTVYFVGGWSSLGANSVSADIETPVWGPTVAAGSYVYDWVMIQNPDGLNPYLAQIGWMADSSGGLYVAAYAWVSGTGGWSDYKTFPNIALTRGQTTHYEIVAVGDNWWSLRVNGTEVTRYNLPVTPGTPGLPQLFLESSADNAIPDIGHHNVEMGSCSLSASAPYSLVNATCGDFYARR